MRGMQTERSQSFAILALLLIFGTSIAGAQEGAAPAPREPAAQFKLMISAYTDGAPIPMPFSCAAQRDEKASICTVNSLNPALKWTDAPKGTGELRHYFLARHRGDWKSADWLHRFDALVGVEHPREKHPNF